jgi:hypothetical protein
VFAFCCATRPVWSLDSTDHANQCGRLLCVLKFEVVASHRIVDGSPGFVASFGSNRRLYTWNGWSSANLNTAVQE